MSEFKVVPIDGENYNEWQYGWRILRDGAALIDCSTGGTGPCWNLDNPPTANGDDYTVPLHICSLEDAIAALVTLRDSEAHKQNVERWQ